MLVLPIQQIWEENFHRSKLDAPTADGNGENTSPFWGLKCLGFLELPQVAINWRAPVFKDPLWHPAVRPGGARSGRPPKGGRKTPNEFWKAIQINDVLIWPPNRGEAKQSVSPSHSLWVGNEAQEKEGDWEYIRAFHGVRVNKTTEIPRLISRSREPNIGELLLKAS